MTCSTVYSSLIAKTDPWTIQSHWTCSSTSSILTLPVATLASSFWTLSAPSLQYYLRNSLKNVNIILSVPLSLCHWILHFLVARPQSVKLNKLQPFTIILNTGVPQGCVLSPLLYSLFTNDCVPNHASVQLIIFADDTIAEGLIKQQP